MIHGQHADLTHKPAAAIDPLKGGNCGDPVPHEMEAKLRPALRQLTLVARAIRYDKHQHVRC